jgi:hypothetical protein
MAMIVGALWVNVHCTTVRRGQDAAQVLVEMAQSPLREWARRVTIRRKLTVLLPERDVRGGRVSDSVFGVFSQTGSQIDTRVTSES